MGQEIGLRIWILGSTESEYQAHRTTRHLAFLGVKVSYTPHISYSHEQLTATDDIETLLHKQRTDFEREPL
ncbi:uncharacterized protein SEPMUDRAFT_112324 [Sphaerulina musiva SO2202]|uniref:Uncharacterized protein n=1 Tax=Sphaerulina musiva (strain SO2202) TaxID=692275 RepID=N1QLX9_SPHMS|nr:uncharacterized protein SEPMUDRAFT_112324 [Sphaerulina musiva SO2202]EMF16264.1 hypothetical protein SEPMUDRAFT_112324 [Sphaerulina musiva SO2202]